MIYRIVSHRNQDLPELGLLRGLEKELVGRGYDVARIFVQQERVPVAQVEHEKHEDVCEANAKE